MAPLAVGEKAPEFSLPSTTGRSMTLAELLDDSSFVVLAFYPKQRTSVCGAQLEMINEFIDQFDERDAAVVGISVDPLEDLLSWADEANFDFPLLSDAEPKGATAEAYGVMSDKGVSERAYFIVDADGVIVYSYLSPMGENPGVNRLFAALDEAAGDQ